MAHREAARHISGIIFALYMCQLILELLQVQEPPFYPSRWGLGLTAEHCDQGVVVFAYLKLNSIEVQVELLTCPSDG